MSRSSAYGTYVSRLQGGSVTQLLVDHSWKECGLPGAAALATADLPSLIIVYVLSKLNLEEIVHKIKFEFQDLVQVLTDQGASVFLGRLRILL